MPATSVVPIEGALKSATERQAAMANCVVRLFKDSIVPDSTTTLAQLQDNQADYAGYAEAAIVAWLGPILAPGSGYEILSPLVLFTSVPEDPANLNSIGGAYIVDAGGVCRRIIRYAAPIPMGATGQGIADVYALLFPS